MPAPPFPWLLLGAACWATFIITGSGVVRSPFLLEIARDLSSSFLAVANLFSFTAFAWGIAALFAGATSDRIGRRPLLVVAHLALIVGTVGVANSHSYPVVAFWTLVAGAGGGGHMGVIFAAVSDHVPPDRRGRALGWIITGQSLSFVVGVPLATWIGSMTDWRGVMLGVAAADVVAILGLWTALPGGRHVPASAAPSLRQMIPEGRVAMLLAAGTTERVCYGVVAVYFATLLKLRYDLSLAQLTLPLALMAAGNLVGNAAGGRIADQLPRRERSFALASLATGGLAILLFAIDTGLWTAVGLGFAYAFVNALGRPAIVAVLSEVSREMRGAILGLNITCASLGWITAAAAGGVMIDRFGVGSVAVLTACMSLLGAALALVAGRR
ncbi:MAG: MFS transporter [Alphaproteobacteria bacterium]|nr:MFS transporter [Alphaproteobacteria bacterium]